MASLTATALLLAVLLALPASEGKVVCYSTAGIPSDTPPYTGGYRKYSGENMKAGTDTGAMRDAGWNDWRFGCVNAPSNELKWPDVTMAVSGDAAPCMLESTDGTPKFGSVVWRFVDTNEFDVSPGRLKAYGDSIQVIDGHDEDALFKEYCAGAANLGEFLSQPGCYFRLKDDTSCVNGFTDNGALTLIFNGNTLHMDKVGGSPQPSDYEDDDNNLEIHTCCSGTGRVPDCGGGRTIGDTCGTGGICKFEGCTCNDKRYTRNYCSEGCGDGTLQVGAGEECDSTDRRFCSAQCLYGFGGNANFLSYGGSPGQGVALIGASVYFNTAVFEPITSYWVTAEDKATGGEAPGYPQVFAGGFSVGWTLTGLQPNTEYRVRAVARTSQRPTDTDFNGPAVTSYVSFITSCSCTGGPPDGTPDQFSTDQSGQYVYFRWRDRASCESRFNVYRQRETAVGSGVWSSPTLITSYAFKGAATCDQVFTPTATPDPIAELDLGWRYQYHIEAQALPPAREHTSGRASYIATVTFTTNINGRVVTATNAGVAGATIVVKSSDGSQTYATLTSDRSGDFKSELTIPGVYVPIIELLYEVSLTTAGITHEFICAGSACTSQLAAATHLGTSSPSFTDTTVVEITGVVTVADTAPYTGGNGPCKVVSPDAKVCAYRLDNGIELACVGLSRVSATLGRFLHTIPTSITIVLRPMWTAGELEHTFAPAERELTILSSNIGGNDFVDTTTAELEITAVAGACSLYMGPSRLFLELPTCGAYSRTLNAGNMYKGQRTTAYTLPAAGAVVTYRDIDPARPDLTLPPESISPLQVPIYLSNIGMLEQEADLSSALEPLALRFEYRVAPTMTVDPIGVVFSDLPCESPIAVVQSQVPYSTTLRLFEDYGDAGPVCTDIDGKVRLFDEASDPKASPCSAQAKPGFCDTDIARDKFGRAIIKFSIYPGSPNIVPPHLSSLRFQMKLNAGVPMATLTVAVIVEGDRPRGFPFTLRLPAYVPSLVLHDPPGDGSCALWTSETAHSFEVALSEGTDDSKSLGVTASAGVAFEVETCAGVGVAVCQTAAEVSVSVEVAAGVTWGTSKADEKTMGITQTTTTTYGTSCDEGGTAPGQESDMILSPVITVQYVLMDTVKFNADVCEASVSSSVKWGPVPNKANALLFHALSDIRDFVVPELERTALFVKPNELERLALLNRGIKGWNKVINDILASYRTSPPLAVGFVPSGGGLDVGGGGGAIDRFVFSGGGATIQRTSATTSSKSTSHSVTSFLTGAQAITVAAEMTVGIVSLGVGTDFAMEQTVSTGKTSTTTEESTSTTDYVLTDNDVGDFFEVALRTDSVYGTPLFVREGGASSCPSEPTSVLRETFDMLFRSANLVENLPADASAFFEFEIQNLAPYEEELNLVLSVDTSTNPDALQIFFQSTTLLDRAITVPYGAAYVALIETKRGPLAWLYPDVTLSLASACDGGQLSVERDISAMYLQPCSSTSWAGDLALAGSWIVNGEPSVFPDVLRGYAKNPQYSEYRWATHTRTTSVRLEYRPVGSLFWRAARDADSQVLDITAREDPFGFVLFAWDLAVLPDGVYDIRAIARCAPSPAGGDFDQSSSPVLRGIVDRVRPELFGFPEPADGIFFPGDEVSFTFDAEILCSKPFVFATTVLIAGVDLSASVPVKCVGDQVLLSLSKLPKPIESYGGAEVVISLTGVLDLAGNSGLDFTHTFKVFAFTGATADALLHPIPLQIPFADYKANEAALVDAFVRRITDLLLSAFPSIDPSQIENRAAISSSTPAADGTVALALYFSSAVEPTAGELAHTTQTLLAELAATAAAARPPEPVIPDPEEGVVDTRMLAADRKAMARASAGRAVGVRTAGLRAVNLDADVMMSLGADMAPQTSNVPSASDAQAAAGDSAVSHREGIAANFKTAKASSVQAPKVVHHPKRLVLSASAVAVIVIGLVAGLVLLLTATTLVVMYRRVVFHVQRKNGEEQGLLSAVGSEASSRPGDSGSSAGSDSHSD